jgi:transcription elongation factor Elf1
MPNTGRPLPLLCTECQHVGAMLVVRAISVITAECAKCGRVWAMSLDSLPVDIQAKVLDTIHDDQRT